MHPLSGFSAVGSAHVWGARGRWFESSNPDRKKKHPINRLDAFLFFCVLPQTSYITIGPCPIHDVVVMAVRKAVRAATTTFTATSITRFVFIIPHFLIFSIPQFKELPSRANSLVLIRRVIVATATTIRGIRGIRVRATTILRGSAILIILHVPIVS